MPSALKVPEATGDPTADEAKALTHPLRRQLLIEFRLGTRSPTSLAEQLDAPLGNVSYHVKTLLSLKMVELVKTEPRRGAVEHFYRAVGGPRDAEVLDQIAALARRVEPGDLDADAAMVEISALVASTGREVV